MKFLETIEHAQVEFFILIIRVPQDIKDQGYLNTLRELIHSLYEHLQYTLEIKTKSHICDSEGILKTEYNLQHLTRNCSIKNLDDFEKDEAEAQSRTFKYEGERNDHMLHYEQVYGNVFERRESKCCAALMKDRLKGKGEQVIILQMDKQLKTENISDVS